MSFICSFKKREFRLKRKLCHDLFIFMLFHLSSVVHNTSTQSKWMITHWSKGDILDWIFILHFYAVWHYMRVSKREQIFVQGLTITCHVWKCIYIKLMCDKLYCSGVRECFHLCFYINETEITSTEQQQHRKDTSQNCLTALLSLLNIKEMKWRENRNIWEARLRKFPHMCLLWSFNVKRPSNVKHKH